MKINEDIFWIQNFLFSFNYVEEILLDQLIILHVFTVPLVSSHIFPQNSP